MRAICAEHVVHVCQGGHGAQKTQDGSQRNGLKLGTRDDLDLSLHPALHKPVPAGDDWQHEVKFDGYHVQAHKLGKDVVIFSRNGYDLSSRFTTIASLPGELPAKSAILDGEIVASDSANISSSTTSARGSTIAGAKPVTPLGRPDALANCGNSPFQIGVKRAR